MNSKNTNNIYDLSKQLQEDQDKKFELQAKNIANAYRKVEQLKVSVPHQKQIPKKEKPQSTYAMKIKETLKQINANKAKQLESINKYMNQRIPIVPSNLFSKLQRTSANKFFNVLQNYNARITGESYKRIVTYCNQEQKREIYFIQKFRVYKLFRAWRDQILYEKLQRQKAQKQQESNDLKSEQLARQFRIFVMLKKAFKFWVNDTKKQIKRKMYQQQLIKQQIKQKCQQEKKCKNKKVEENSQLQNKVRGFLDGLKEKIEQKDRLKTIKEKTQQSRANENSINVQYIEKQQEDIDEHSNQNSSQAEMGIQAEIIIQPPIPQGQKKPMTNEDLQKKRKQLEAKHKSRKEALQKLRKDKEDKKKQGQKQKNELQKEIQIQQRRIKQEKYRQFLKSKQEQQQWQKKEKILNEKADQFNEFRLKKYYGWQPFVSIKRAKIAKATMLYDSLLLVVYRFKGTLFLNNLKEVSQMKLDNQLKRMEKRYSLNVLRKAFKGFTNNREYELQQKDNYKIMHDVNTLKIFFASWHKITPVLSSQNYDWERPRNRRAQEFYKLQLLHKGLRSLKINQDLQQKQRCIAQQKTKIKNKIKNMLQENDSFNYQDFL